MQLINIFERHVKQLPKPCCVVFDGGCPSSTKELEDFKNYVESKQIDSLTIHDGDASIRDEEAKENTFTSLE